jgi:hypothetical protein
MRKLLFFGALTLAGRYFFDPDEGEARRAKALDQLSALMNKARGQAENFRNTASS